MTGYAQERRDVCRHGDLVRRRGDRPPSRDVHRRGDRSPSRARVKALHTAYVDALLRMIERTKREAGYPTQETVIV